LITLWYHRGEWRLSTSGAIDADTTSNGAEYTFAELVWNTAALMYGSKESFLARLNTKHNYMFELCTPWNIVVTQHQTSKLVLHGVRDMSTYKELHIHDFDLVQVKVHDLKNEAEICATFAGKSWQEEGYIVMDKTTMERVKIKNPAYVSVHHVKTGVSPYEIVNVIKTNEISEFCVYFKERTEFILRLDEEWVKLENMLNSKWKHVLNEGRFETQKDFAITMMKEVERPFHSVMFNMKSGKIDNIRAGMCALDTKFLYFYLQPEK